MNKLYIVLILIGIISLVSGAQTPFNYNRPEPVQCSSDQPTVGCQQCGKADSEYNEEVQYWCTSPQEGYFIDNNETNTVAACDRSCKSCTSEGCTTCQTQWFKDSLQVEDKCTECKDGFTFDIPSTTPRQGICISVASTGEYSCADGYFWDSTPNQDRKCVGSSGNCANGYAIKTGSTSSTEDCVQCANSFRQLSGVAVDGDGNRYKIQTCVNYQAPTQRVAEKCTPGGQSSVQGCATCEDGTCKLAEPGFYLQDGQAASCPSQCAECSSASVCTKCPNNIEVDANKNCGCSQGYVPNIDKSLLTNPINQFTCIKYSEGAPCAQGFIWNVPAIVPQPSTKQACISIYDQNDCYKDDDQKSKGTEFDQSSYWNAPINPNTANSRQCQLNSVGACLDGYAVATTENGIASNCYACAENKTKFEGTWIYNDASYTSFICAEQQAPDLRKPAEQCNSGKDKVTGCSACDKTANTCTTPEKGYYIFKAIPSRLRNLAQLQNDKVVGQAYACPSQCADCQNGDGCTECPANYKQEGTNCVCKDGQVPSISKEQAKNPKSDFVCIAPLITQCSPEYTWNTGVILPQSDQAECIFPVNGTCYKDQHEQQSEPDLTNYWNSPPSSTRQCVLASSGQCTGNSSPTEGGKSEGPLTGDCKYCASGYVLSNDAKNQTCVIKTSSGILSVSLVLIGIILSIFI